MITGETEQLLEDYLPDEYDVFFGNKKRRLARRTDRKTRSAVRKSAPKRIERKTKRTKFFKEVGKIYRDTGGATAIGTAIDSFTKPKLPEIANTDVQSDFSIDLGAPKKDDTEKKGIPTIFYVLGGVLVVGVLGIALMKSKKNHSFQTHPQ
jgi:hypothetical protein